MGAGSCCYGRFASSWLAFIALYCALLGPLSASAYDAEAKIESARLYGDVSGEVYAYYFVDLLLGSPKPQRTSVIVDTGSTVAGFPCSGCKGCGKHIDTAFDTSKSKTFKWLKCGQGCSGDCNGDRCTYQQSYAEGSSIRGSWFLDYISLGDELQHNPAVLGRMGCHNHETNLFYSQKANGILGMGPVTNGKHTLLEDLYKDNAHINSKVFAMCLSDNGGALTFGGHNTSLHTGSIQWLSMPRSTRYDVTPIALNVGGLSVGGNGFGNTFVDSGTTYTYLPHSTYVALKDKIATWCEAHGHCGDRKKDGGSCFSIKDGYAGLVHFPTITWTFRGDMKFLWKPQSYLYRKRGSQKRYCYGFEDNGGARETVLGATWMLDHDIIFDIAQNRLGFAEAKCPKHRKRPPPPSGTLVITKDGALGQGKPAQQWLPGIGQYTSSNVLSTLMLVFVIVGGLGFVWRNLRIASKRAGDRSLATLSSPPVRIVSTVAATPQLPDARSRGATSGAHRGVPLDMWLRATSGGESSGSDASSEGAVGRS